MKQTKRLALLLALVLALSLFTGCAKETAAPAAEETPATETTPTETPADAEEAPAETAPAAEEAPAQETAEQTAEEAAGETAAVQDPGYQADGTYLTAGGMTYPLAEHVTLSMTQIYNPNASVVYDQGDYTMALSYADLAANTNIDIEFEMMSEAAYEQLINLRIASGDYPDIWGRDCGSYKSDMIGGVEDEVLLDVAPLIAEYAPDWYNLIQSDEDYHDSLYNSDGSLTQIAGRTLSMTTSGGLIRADWLADLGLEAPTDLDSLTDVLYAFHDAYDCRLTILLDSDLSCAASGAFNMQVMGFNGLSFQQTEPDSGVVECGYASQGYIDYLNWLAKLYADGLISGDFISTSKNDGNFETCYLNGDSGVWTDDAKYSFSSISNDPNWDAQAFALSLEGNHFTSSDTSGSGISMTVAYLSGSCSNPQAALALFNYGFTQAGKDLIALGVEDVTYVVNEDGSVAYTELITNNPDGYNSEQAKYAYLTEPWMPTDQQLRVFEMSYVPRVLEAYEIWSGQDKSVCDDAMAIDSTWQPTTEENQRINERAADILTIFEEAAYKRVMNQIDELGYRDAITTAGNAGLNDITQLWQTIFDEYVAGLREPVEMGAGGPGGPPM